MEFKKATKEQSLGRQWICGPAGSGKTYTSLISAKALAPEGRIALIDTENGSASKYSDEFDFDTLKLEPPFTTERYIEAIHTAENAGYDVIIIDGLSAAWNKDGGILRLNEEIAQNSASGNSFTSWNKVTPKHDALIDAILYSSCHIIATARTKTEYVISDGSDGKKRGTPVAVGLAPIQRDEVAYEFDIVAYMSHAHMLAITKTRCSALDGVEVLKPDVDFFKVYVDWLNDGVEAKPKASPSQKADLLNKARELSEAIIDAMKFDPCPKLLHEKMTHEKMMKMKPASLEKPEQIAKMEEFIVDMEELLKAGELPLHDETDEFVDDVATNPKMEDDPDALTDADIPFGGRE